MAKPATLYELTEQTLVIESILNAVEAGELGEKEASDALYDSLIATDEALEAKVERYIRLIRDREALAEIRKNEAAHLTARAKTAENEAKKLKEALRYAMEQLGRSKIQAGPFTAAITANGGALPMEVSDLATGENVDERFRKVTVSIDTAAVRRALEDGEHLDFASLGERGTHLRIR